MKKIFLFFVIGIVLLANDIEPNLDNKAYKSPLNPSAKAGFGGQCTAFVWGRVYEKFNIELGINTPRGVPHANKWWTDNLFPKTLKRGSIPKSNSIVIWSGDFNKKSNGKYKNPYGHVAFIEKIEDGKVYFNEANVETYNGTKWGGGYDGHIKIWPLEAFKKYRNYAGDILGYIYLTSDESAISTNLAIVDGAGSLIRPEILGTADENKCQWGCYRDEADMQIHSSNPSTVSFQWKATSNCKKLRIGVLASKEYREKYNTWINPHNPLKVKIYTKAWDSEVVSEAFKTTLPKTVDYVDGWNNIIITSQEPLSKKMEIIAECTENDDYKDVTMLDDETTVNLPLDYKFGGQSSIIRGSNKNYNKQIDGIYQDVAIGLSSNKAMILFQWQTSSNCSSLILKSGHYPSDNGVPATVNGVSIKGWSIDKWTDNICDKKLPCEINAPSTNGGKYENYYIIKVKINANALEGNRISAVCKE